MFLKTVDAGLVLSTGFVTEGDRHSCSQEAIEKPNPSEMLKNRRIMKIIKNILIIFN